MSKLRWLYVIVPFILTAVFMFNKSYYQALFCFIYGTVMLLCSGRKNDNNSRRDKIPSKEENK